VRAAPRHRGAIIAVLPVLTLVACSSPATGTPPPNTPSATAPTATSTPTPTPTPGVVSTLAGCAAPVTRSALHVVHHFTVSPDDIAVDTSGRLWVSAREANQVTSMTADGSGIATFSVTGGPEGVAVAASGVYIAQQNTNAIEQITPQRREVVVLPNRTANAGIDGISAGITGSTLLVPDSPAGTLLDVSLVGPATTRVIAQHLGRPVAAIIDASGNIYVASESLPGLVRVAPSGTVTRIGAFSDLDEVIESGGLLYVTELDRHDVVAVDPRTGASVVIASNLPAPQGLAVTASGTLEIVDATTNTLYSLPACGVA
jgi:hypothetical protein